MQRTEHRLRISLLLMSLTLACACSNPTPQDAPAVGLDAIRARGTLRLLTRNNGFTYFVLRGRPLGFDYELAEGLADHLGVQLEVIVPPDWKDLIPMLQRGEGDLIGASLAITDNRKGDVAYAEPYHLTQMRVVWGPGQEPIDHAEELSGRPVHVRRTSSYNAFLTRFNALLISAGRKPVDVVFESEALETDALLRDTAAGRIPYTLCGHYRCLETKSFSPNLVLGPPVTEPYGKAWAVHPEAQDLLAAVNAYLAQQRSRGVLDQLHKRYYESQRLQTRRHEGGQLDSLGRVSPWDKHIQEAAERFGFDWRLLAALAYQESQFDPKAKTHTGGRGLFGILPATAHALKMGNPTDPTKAPYIAAAHLSSLRGEFAQVPVPETQLKLAIASYQAGPEHVQDARILASAQKLDPNDWDDVAKVLPLLAMEEFASQAKFGYVRGSETVRYTENVWTRYRAYRHAMGERDMPKAARAP